MSGQAAVDAGAGVFDPAHAGAVAEGSSRGGQVAVDAGAGIFNPAHAGAVAEGRSRGGQAAGQANLAAANLAAADMASVCSLQAEQEARGGPVVGSRKRKSTQRMKSLRCDCDCGAAGGFPAALRTQQVRPWQ